MAEFKEPTIEAVTQSPEEIRRDRLKKQLKLIQRSKKVDKALVERKKY